MHKVSWRRKLVFGGVCVMLLTYAFWRSVDWLARQSLPTPPGPFHAVSTAVNSQNTFMDVSRFLPEMTDTSSHALTPSKNSVLPEGVASNTVDAIPGEYILSWQHVADSDRLLALAQQYDVQVLDSYGNAMRVRSMDHSKLAAFLRSVPPAVRKEANLRVRIPVLDQTEDSLAAPQTPYAGFGDQALAWLGVPAPEAEWGNGIRMAVLDTGITGISVSERLNLTGEVLQEGHGTLVASIMRQMLPAAELLDVKVMRADGTGNSFTVAKGIREAVDAGAQIINMSIGTRGDSAFLLDAIRYAHKKGVLIVASAGNEGLARVSYPAAYTEVLSVAAVDAEERHLYFSNRGDAVDISAPGVGVAVALGADGELVPFSGTSAAAPFVSATAGLALWRDRDLQGDDLFGLLTALANDTGEPGEDALTGAGIVSPQRLEEKDQPDLLDMVVMRPFYHVGENQTVEAISVAAENRGTTFLSSIEMNVIINDEETSLTFQNLPPGATVAHRIDARAYAQEDGTWDVIVRVPLQGDIRPGDNQRRVVRLQVEP